MVQDSADKKFEPMSSIIPKLNLIHHTMWKLWALKNFDAYFYEWKDEQTNIWMD